jgi:hypothetical protein
MREQQSSASEHAWPAALQLSPTVGVVPTFVRVPADAETANPTAKLAMTAMAMLFMVLLVLGWNGDDSTEGHVAENVAFDVVRQCLTRTYGAC